MSSLPANYRVWPEFHNGVAAGLRLPRDTSGHAQNERVITRTWIKYNKPVVAQPQESGANSNTPTPPSYAHGGFLMAL
jgi:anaphase-promoting complex subunit 1